MALHPVSTFLTGACLSGATLLLSACEAKPQTKPAPKAAQAAEDHSLRVKAIGSYILVQSEGGNHTFVCSDGTNIQSMPALKARFGNAFLWFRHEKKAYVIQDPATLAKARELFKDDPELEAQEKALEEQESKLDKQRDAIDARRDVLDQQRDRLEAQTEGLDEETQGATQALARMDVEQRKLDKDMQALDKELEALDKELETMSKQLETVSARQERLMNAAEQQLQLMMVETVKRGVAQPVNDKIK